MAAGGPRKRSGTQTEVWVPHEGGPRSWISSGAGWRRQAVIGFYLKKPLEGYRRLTFMMLNGDIVAVSASSLWWGAQAGGPLVEVQRQTVEAGRGASCGRSASALASRSLRKGGAEVSTSGLAFSRSSGPPPGSRLREYRPYPEP